MNEVLNLVLCDRMFEGFLVVVALIRDFSMWCNCNPFKEFCSVACSYVSVAIYRFIRFLYLCFKALFLVFLWLVFIITVKFELLER